MGMILNMDGGTMETSAAQAFLAACDRRGMAC